jgi:general secretion pathway protein L
MNIVHQIKDSFLRWIDAVAASAQALLNRWGSQRQVVVTEEGQDTFTLHALSGAKDVSVPDQQIRIAQGAVAEGLSADWPTWIRGSRVQLVLQPSRFMFRPLELPKRASEFLDGIVRAQIDRLTPWTAGEAVYSWSPPVEAANDRIQLTVAATARSLVMPYVQAFDALGAASVAVSTKADGSEAAALNVFVQRSGGVLDVTRIRRILTLVFAVAGVTAVLASGLSSFVVDSLDSEQQDITHKITVRRAAMRQNADGGAQRMLERRKQTTPASVIAIEALSKLLPDHTYVTELRIEGGKVQVAGVTADAPSLIRLMEQSPHFARATFYAPTTRSPGEPGERFHIEALLKPHFGPDT